MMYVCLATTHILWGFFVQVCPRGPLGRKQKNSWKPKLLLNHRHGDLIANLLKTTLTANGNKVWICFVTLIPSFPNGDPIKMCIHFPRHVSSWAYPSWLWGRYVAYAGLVAGQSPGTSIRTSIHTDIHNTAVWTTESSLTQNLSMFLKLPLPSTLSSFLRIRHHFLVFDH